MVNDNTDVNAIFKHSGGVELYYGVTGQASSKKLETTATGIDVTGTLTASTDVRAQDMYIVADNKRLRMGASQDFQLLHSGTVNEILAYNYHDTVIKSRTEIQAVFKHLAGVELNYATNKKLETTSTGISVTGGVTTSGDSFFNEDVFFDGATGGRDVRWDRTGNSLRFYDNAVLSIGSDQDVRIWHDGARTNIVENGTGNLGISGNGSVKFDIIQSTYGTDYIARFKNANCELYANATKRLETTSTGVDVNGKVSENGVTITSKATALSLVFS